MPADALIAAPQGAVDALREASRAAAAAYVAECDAVMAMVEAAGEKQLEFVADDVALTLGLSPRTGQNRRGAALTLAARPRTRAALLDGTWTVAHALAVLSALAGLPADAADAAEGFALDRTVSVPGRPRGAVEWFVARHYPEVVEQRRREAVRQQRDVRVRPLTDGLADVVLTCTAAQALAALRRVEAHARAIHTEDDDRSAAALRADAMLHLLAPAGPVALELGIEVPASVSVGAVDPVTHCPEPLQLRMDLPALLRALGVSVEQASRIVDRALGVEPEVEGDVVDGPPGSRRGRRSRRRSSEPPAPAAPESPLVPRGRADLVGYGPIDSEALAELLGQATELTARRVLVDRLSGAVVSVSGPVRDLTDLVRGRGSRGARRRFDRSTGLLGPSPRRRDRVRLLIDGEVEARRAEGYRPPMLLERLVKTRDVTCTFPGCGVRAERCDVDHLIPWAAGGPTSVSNLHCLCRHHHRLKHTAGWTVTRLVGGTLRWRSPNGATRDRPPDGGCG